jgi:osmotically-inducible protein OsmY
MFRNATLACALAATGALAACGGNEVANTNANANRLANSNNSNVGVLTNSNTANTNVRAANRDDDVDVSTPDGWITAKTKLAMAASADVAAREVDVDTANGVVTLSGKVETAAAKAAAERVAKGIDGVTSVKNELQVVPEAQDQAVEQKDEDIQGAVNDLLDNDAGIKDLDISGKVNAGVVTLNGSVDNPGTLARAVTAVRRVPGVKRVVTSAVKIDVDKAPTANANASNTNRRS